ncbi:tripartite motif-containing protein 3-like [Branchiostoma lanceolatum]|uniref:tripartite motif-containing protein 3-like n=1 Tax=Branchiostoma lanceolatum TaxID=7740 RepID=UPI0034551295
MAAAPSSLGTQIREELSCSICLDLLTRPKVLPCQHTFCQDCLQDLASRRLPLQCPNCRQQVWLPPQGVAGLPDNRLVTSLCERLQGQATLSEETWEQPQSGNRCSFHPSEKIKLYCKQCQVPLCVDCIAESHEGHPTMSITKASQERRSTVQVLINEGRNILETYLSFLRGLRQKEKSLNEQKQQTDNSIIQAYNQMVQKLTEQKDCFLAEAEQKQSKVIKEVQDKRDMVLADVNELSAACDRAEQKMKEERDMFLSQETALTEVVGKYRGKAAPTPVQTQPAVFQPTGTPLPVLGHMTGHMTVSSVPGPGDTSHQQSGGQPGRVTFGGEGEQPGKFKDPLGVAVSQGGEVFVAEYGNERIQVFTLQGTFVRLFPTVVPGKEAMYPHDVAMDGEGNLWVVGNTSSANHAVCYTKHGKALRKFDLQYMLYWKGIAVDTRRNHILVTQTAKNDLHSEVQIFTPDGTLVRTVGQQQGLEHPWHITVDGEGNILASDWGNHYVYVYNEDGQFLFKFRDAGSVEGQLKNPQGICTDRAGNIIVADSGNKRVELFDKTGRFLRHITTDMEGPYAVAMGPQGQLVVTDTKLRQVTIFNSY